MAKGGNQAESHPEWSGPTGAISGPTLGKLDRWTGPTWQSNTHFGWTGQNTLYTTSDQGMYINREYKGGI